MSKQSKQAKPQIDLSNLSMDGLSPDNGVYQPNLTSISSDPVDQVRDVLETGVDIETRLKDIGTNEGQLAASLYHYELLMNPKTSKDYTPSVLGTNNYNLYNKLIRVINSKQYEIFVPMFDVVNLFFNKFKESSFDEVMLNRADLYFAGDKKQLKTYQRLITIISILANPVTRNKSKNLVTPSSVFDRDITTFTEEAINNIKKYYDL